MVDEINPEWRGPKETLSAQDERVDDFAVADAQGDGRAGPLETLSREALLRRLSSVEAQLSRLTRTEKRGWLYRFNPYGGSWLQPWGDASRWEMRFFVLQPKVDRELQARDARRECFDRAQMWVGA
eukprot:2688145-Pleurochrysis_carterae.AAC.9